MQPALTDTLTFESVHTTLTIRRLSPAVVLVEFQGDDVGELLDAPFRALDGLLDEAGAPVDLFIDARAAGVASLDVSGAWARWLASRRARLARVTMLTGSPFITLSAGFVRRFARLGDLMQVGTDAHAFDGRLDAVVRATQH